MDTDSTNQTGRGTADRVAPEFHHDVAVDLRTLITSLHISWRMTGTPVEVAAVIDPTYWSVNPEGGQFFRTARWIDQPSGPMTAHEGLFYEHLEFHAGSELLRSVENNLHLTYTGFGDEQATIGCTFDLHESLDDLLSIDRGWFRAKRRETSDIDAGEGSAVEWYVEMMKYVRFRDPVNTGLAPVLLAAWAQAAWPEIIRYSENP
jgi:hypothetical protein